MPPAGSRGPRNAPLDQFGLETRTQVQAFYVRLSPHTTWIFTTLSEDDVMVRRSRYRGLVTQAGFRRVKTNPVAW